MNSVEKADLYKPIYASRRGAPPLTLRVIVTSDVAHVQGGVATGVAKVENYVLLSALPTELQERVKTAIQCLISAM
jgi:hypothetical protein